MSTEAGTFRATIATLAPAVDADGDVSMPGAFPVLKSVPVSAYGHGSWKGALPIGRATIAADSSKAWVVGQFFLDVPAARDAYRVLKGLDELAQWSYGYSVESASFNSAELAKYPGAKRILQKLDVFEVSPVLVGAGVNTRTESIKREVLSTAKLIEIGQRIELARIKEQLETELFRNSWQALTERVDAALRRY